MTLTSCFIKDRVGASAGSINTEVNCGRAFLTFEQPSAKCPEQERVQYDQEAEGRLLWLNFIG